MGIAISLPLEPAKVNSQFVARPTSGAFFGPAARAARPTGGPIDPYRLNERIMVMRAFDFTPLLRSSIGFENLNRLVDLASRDAAAEAFPPYNIEKVSQDAYRISMAIAGFSREELDLTVQEHTLVVTG